jgi:hypothetical protein
VFDAIVLAPHLDGCFVQPASEDVEYTLAWHRLWAEWAAGARRFDAATLLFWLREFYPAAVIRSTAVARLRSGGLNCLTGFWRQALLVWLRVLLAALHTLLALRTRLHAALPHATERLFCRTLACDGHIRGERECRSVASSVLLERAATQQPSVDELVRAAAVESERIPLSLAYALALPSQPDATPFGGGSGEIEREAQREAELRRSVGELSAADSEKLTQLASTLVELNALVHSIPSA